MTIIQDGSHVPPLNLMNRARRKRKAAILGAVESVIWLLRHRKQAREKVPMHTSILTGQKWVEELLNGISFLAKSLTRY